MSQRQEAYSNPDHIRPDEKRNASGMVPRAVVRSDALSYHLLRPKDAGPADVPLLGEAYRCWSEVWHQTLDELDGLKNVPSDDFSRQDQIGALFHDWECIGMTAFRWVDLSSPIDQDDSYFSVWPRDCVDALRIDGARVCVVSNFTVAAPWRRASGPSVKDLLAMLAVDRFLQSDVDAMAGTMRNDRGMNTLVYRVGCQPLARDVMHHGVTVDLVAYYRRAGRRPPLDVEAEALVQKLLPAKVLPR